MVNGAGSKITSEPAPLEVVEGRYAAQVLTLFWNLRLFVNDPAPFMPKELLALVKVQK